MESLRVRLVSVLLITVALSILCFSFITLAAFEWAIAPELERRTLLIGTLIRSEIQRVLELGVPVAALGGLDAYVDDTLRSFPEINAVSISSASGEVLSQIRREDTPGPSLQPLLGGLAGIEAGELRLPVLLGTDVVAEIAITGDSQFVETRLRSVLFDVAILALAIILLGVEAILAYATGAFSRPYQGVLAILREQRDGQFRHLAPETGPPAVRRLAARLNDRVRHLSEWKGLPDSSERLDPSGTVDARLPLFLLALATETTASFLPVLSAQAERPEWLSGELAAAAPIIAYLVCMAAFSPLAGVLVRAVGARRLFAAATAPIALALCTMALVDTLLGITLARAGVAVGYALASISCQTYAIRASDAASASSGFVGTTSALFAGVLSGSIIGGVVASQFGYAAAILMGAAGTIAAAAVGWRMLRGRAGAPEEPAARASLAAGNGTRVLPFGALTLGVALPTSAVTAIFVWYLTPLILTSEGFRTADVARAVMLYYLAAICFGPIVGRLTTTQPRAMASMLCGAALSGGALLAASLWQGSWPLLLAIAGVGLGHTLIRSPLISLLLGWARASGPALDAFRFSERLGAVLGLAGASLSFGAMQAPEVPAWLGVLPLAGVAASGIIIASSLRGKESKAS